MYKEGDAMTTNIDLNQKLIEQAMQISGHRTKKAVVNQALEEFVRRHEQQGILDLFGEVEYETDYDYKTHRKRGGNRS